MMEIDWLDGIDPIPMLDFLQNRSSPSERKLRLFAVACSRRVWDFLDPLGRAAVTVAELFADGLTGTEELRAARLACKSAGGRAVWYAAASNPSIAARNAALSVQSGADAASVLPDERTVQANLLRDIFGNPFRQITLDPSWRTRTLTAFAQTIYADRAFDRLSVLAEALEEAGCADTAILSHCRQPGGHVRGCWAVDLLLGKG